MRERVLERGGARVEAEPRVTGPAQRAELDAQPVGLARHASQRVRDEQLVVPHPVEVASVDQVDAGVEGRAYRRDARCAIGRSVDARHAHRPEPERRDVRAGLAEATRLHGAAF